MAKKTKPRDPKSSNIVQADERQRAAWLRCGKELHNLRESIGETRSDLKDLVKRQRLLTRELEAAATEERLPLFETQFARDEDGNKDQEPD